MKTFILMVGLAFLCLSPLPGWGQNPRSLELQGIELCNEGKYDQALNLFTQGLKQNPHDPQLLYLRGKTYTAKGRYREALADLNQALKLKPNFGAAYFARAMVAVYQENYEEALQDLKLAEQHGYKDADFLKLVQNRAEQKRKR